MIAQQRVEPVDPPSTIHQQNINKTSTKHQQLPGRGTAIAKRPPSHFINTIT